MPRTSRSPAFSGEAGSGRRAGKVKVPPDFAKALRGRPKIWRLFQSLAPSHQREYADWVTAAVKTSTRRTRISAALKLIVKRET